MYSLRLLEQLAQDGSGYRVFRYAMPFEALSVVMQHPGKNASAP